MQAAVSPGCCGRAPPPWTPVEPKKLQEFIKASFSRPQMPGTTPLPDARELRHRLQGSLDEHEAEKDLDEICEDVWMNASANNTWTRTTRKFGRSEIKEDQDKSFEDG